MIDLKQMTRAELEDFYDVAHDGYREVCEQNERFKKALRAIKNMLKMSESSRNRFAAGYNVGLETCRVIASDALRDDRQRQRKEGADMVIERCSFSKWEDQR